MRVGDVALPCVIDQPETKQHNPNYVNIMPFSHLIKTLLFWLFTTVMMYNDAV